MVLAVTTSGVNGSYESSPEECCHLGHRDMYHCVPMDTYCNQRR